MRIGTVVSSAVIRDAYALQFTGATIALSQAFVLIVF